MVQSSEPDMIDGPYGNMARAVTGPLWPTKTRRRSHPSSQTLIDPSRAPVMRYFNGLKNKMLQREQWTNLTIDLILSVFLWSFHRFQGFNSYLSRTLPSDISLVLPATLRHLLTGKRSDISMKGETILCTTSKTSISSKFCINCCTNC